MGSPINDVTGGVIRDFVATVQKPKYKMLDEGGGGQNYSNLRDVIYEGSL